ncbi:MAG: adenylate/guanylate cyclase domain-containing protein [Bacteroidia bacterium]
MPNPRLAAIMFTDIVGYTSMMQSDQELAMDAVKQHEAVLKERIAVNGGELLQTYGDGSLSVFESASAAVRCAKEVQLLVRDKVPLRIGIHLGEITQDGDHTFGDGVNIASRIESMGVAGAVLISSSIRQQIKNKAEFELVSLGRFSFKNVLEPMTIYALNNNGFAVPKAKEMHGKGKQFSETKSHPRRLALLASIGFLAMAVGAVLFWTMGGKNTKSEERLAEEIRSERVAVIPFRNNTQDPELDVLGLLCSDLIVNGMIEAEIKTCSPRSVAQYRDKLGIFPDNPGGELSFSEVTGANYWIEGFYFKEGDSLVLKSHLTNALNGELVRNFPEIRGRINQKSQLVGELRQRIMGYWVGKEFRQTASQIPKYEAYQIWTEALESNDGALMFKAFEEDTSFIIPLIEAMIWKTWDEGFMDRIISILEPKRLLMNEYEHNFYMALKSRYLRDYDQYGDFLEKTLQLFPHDQLIKRHYAWSLGWLQNQPEKALDYYLPIDMSLLDPTSFQDKRFVHFPLHLLHKLDRHEEMLDLVEEVIRIGAVWGPTYEFKAIALIHLGREEELNVLQEKIKSLEPIQSWGTQHWDYLSFCKVLADQFLLAGSPEKAKQYALLGVEWATDYILREGRDSTELAQLYIHLQEYESALLVGSRYTDAFSFALTGKKAEALQLKEELENKEASWATYHIARIYAALGDKENVLLYLQKYLNDGGLYMGEEYFEMDVYMRELFGWKPYQDLIRSRSE